VIDHECWWTRNCATRLEDDGNTLRGAGVPRAVLEDLSVFLGERLSSERSSDDEHGDDIKIGSRAEGWTHDGCFFTLLPISDEIKRAAVCAVLSLHSRYLGREFDWTDVRDLLLQNWKEHSALRLRSHPRKRMLTAHVHTPDASWLERRRATRLRIDCSSNLPLALSWRNRSDI